jgi:hypothetical protein
MKLEWTEPSLLDLESIRDYIIKGSAYYAADLYGLIDPKPWDIV